MFRHSNPRNAWITGIGGIPFKPYREEGMIKEPIMWGKKDRRSVGVNKVVFICSTAVRWSSRLLALLGEVPCCSFSRSRQHARYIMPCFTLDNTDSSSAAAMRDQLYNSRCTSICLQPPSQVHLSLLPIKTKKMSSNLGHQLTFLVTSWWAKINPINVYLKVNQNVTEDSILGDPSFITQNLPEDPSSH